MVYHRDGAEKKESCTSDWVQKATKEGIQAKEEELSRMMWCLIVCSLKGCSRVTRVKGTVCQFYNFSNLTDITLQMKKGDAIACTCW